MFWRFGGYNSHSTLIDTLLDDPHVTVKKLLDAPEVVQETKSQNSKLLDFFRKNENLGRLLRIITEYDAEDDENDATDPKSNDSARSNHYASTVSASSTLTSLFVRRSSPSPALKTPNNSTSKEDKRLNRINVAAQILTADVWSFAEALLSTDNRSHLSRFWNFLDSTSPLDLTEAANFARVNEHLLDKKTKNMLLFFKGINGIVETMLRHVDCQVIMDLLLNIINMETRVEEGKGIVDWLQSQGLIPILLSKLSPDNKSSIQSSAGDFIKAIITISANSKTQNDGIIGPNSLTRELVSVTCVRSLIQTMLTGGNPLTVGVGIVIEVIRKNNSDYNEKEATQKEPHSGDPIYLGTLLRQFAMSVSDFMALMHTPDAAQNELAVAFGRKIEPLGFDRFKTCELMAELLHCSNMELLRQPGSEADARARDAERLRLKAKDNLNSFHHDADSLHDFGISVGSTADHHVRYAPLTETKKSNFLETDEDFETVTAAEALIEDVKDDFDESYAQCFEPSVDVVASDLDTSLDNTPDATGLDQPLTEASSPLLSSRLAQISNTSPLEQQSHPASETPMSASEGQLPLVTSLSAIKPVHDKPNQSKPLDVELELPSSTTPIALTPHPEDTPAPLFASKAKLPTETMLKALDPALSSQTALEAPEISSDPIAEHDSQLQTESPLAPTSPAGSFVVHEQTSLGSSDSGNNSLETSIVLTNQVHELPYIPDIDNTPVVGDYLKLQFVKHDVISTILKLFYRFPWNNFLHNVVYDVVQQIFGGKMEFGFNRHLVIDLFENANITESIIQGDLDSNRSQADSNLRLGYMGHLTLIAEEVVKFTDLHNPRFFSPAVTAKVQAPEWANYVEHTLAETRERDNAILGGPRPDANLGHRHGVFNPMDEGGQMAGPNPAGPHFNLENIEPDITRNPGVSSFIFRKSGSDAFSDDEEDNEDAEINLEPGVPNDNEHTVKLTSEPAVYDPADPSFPAPLNPKPKLPKARQRFNDRLAAKEREKADAAAPTASTTTAINDPVEEGVCLSISSDEDSPDDDQVDNENVADSFDDDDPDDIGDVEKLVSADVDDLIASVDSLGESEDVLTSLSSPNPPFEGNSLAGNDEHATTSRQSYLSIQTSKIPEPPPIPDHPKLVPQVDHPL